MYAFVNKNTGEVVNVSGVCSRGGKLLQVDMAAALASAVRQTGLQAADLAAYSYYDEAAEDRGLAAAEEARDAFGAGRLVASLDGQGGVEQVGLEPVNQVWLHLAAAGGDGEDPPGAPTDGTAPLQISAVLRATQDPASAILTGVYRSYRITVRDAATGAVYDVRKITLASGQMAAVNYSGTGQPGICEVLESDFDQVEAGGTLYTVRLAQPVRFKFFGTLD